jgi:hypothetical protein
MGYRWTLTNLSDSSTETLSKDPIGWDEGVYKITRSEKYKGAFQEYTTSLKFHCEGGGKLFIDNVYQTEDIDGRIAILCEYDCDGSGTYDTLFDSIINLASYKEDGTYTIVNIEQSDLLTKLNSRDEIKVDLESTLAIGGETISAISTALIPMTPIKIPFKSRWVINPPYEYDATESHGAGGDMGEFHPAMTLQQGDFTTSNQYPEYGYFPDLVGYFATGFDGTPFVIFNDLGMDYPIQIDWSISLQGTLIDSTDIGSRTVDSYRLLLTYGDLSPVGPVPTQIELYNTGSSTDNPAAFIFNVVDSGTITINPGDGIILAWVADWNNTGAPVNQRVRFQYEESYFEINAETTYQETDCKSVLVHEAFSQVIDSIAGTNGNFESDFYGRTDSQKLAYASDGCGSKICITNGLNIREFSDKQIFCSLTELFTVFDCLHNIGLGVVSGKIRVEPLGYWFDGSTQMLVLPNVNNYETRNDNSRYFNNIQIGYGSWETEFKGGLDEPCTRHEYSTQIASVKTNYTKLCPYIASSYAIELTRRKNIDLFETEDWKYDNENFLIALTRATYGYGDALLPETYYDSFNTGSGMLSLETAYNLALTPARMLQPHMKVITAGLQLINGLIRFIRGDGNTDLQVAKDVDGCPNDFNGQILGENDDFQWDDGNVRDIAPIYLPEIYTFDYPITYTQFKAIKANPYGYIEFYKFADEVKRGFLMNMEYSMKTGMTSFTLLKTA